MSDWYNVSKQDFADNGGSSLLNTYYNEKPSRAVMEIFPSHKWDIWKFRTLPHNFEFADTYHIFHSHIFCDITRQLLEFVKSIESKLKISSPKDWYRVSMGQIGAISHASKTIVLKHGGLSGT